MSVEIDLLMTGIWRHWGYDFRDYASEWTRRRIERQVRKERVGTVSGLQQKVLHDSAAMERLIVALSSEPGGFFREPRIWAAIRTRIVPLLGTYPSVRVWLAGCSTGEDVFSLAIVLAEEGLAERTRIYATDVHDVVLARARAARYPHATLARAADRYREAGGRFHLDRHYAIEGTQAVLEPALVRGVVFAPHNLTTDAAFNEFHLIVCMRQLACFSRSLQVRAFKLFHESLATFGVLVLGARQSMAACPYQDCYAKVPGGAKLYRKVKAPAPPATLDDPVADREVRPWSPSPRQTS